MTQDEIDTTHYGSEAHVRAAVGTQFEDMPVYVDLLTQAGEEVPESCSIRGTHQPVVAPLPYEYYIDPKFVTDEIENIWKKKWQVACREEDIPEVGDRIAYDVATLSFLIVRAGPNEFKAFWNSCRHRGRKLCGKNVESGDVIQCPFHAWTYGLDGALKWVPRQEEFPGVSPETFSLREVKCEIWGGTVFINPDLDSPTLLESLGPMVEHYKDFPLEDRYTQMHIKKRIRINWKSGMEAFLEGYHILTTHPSGMAIFGSTHTQHDCWSGENYDVSRMTTPAVVPDGWVKNDITPRQAIELYCNAYGFKQPLPERGLTTEDARAYATEVVAEQLKSITGHDYSEKSNALLIDMHQWFSFPNHLPWWGEGLPWWYNFIPVGDSPDECEMEIRLMLPVPKNGERPPKAETVYVGLDEKCEDYPESGQVGLILDEDLDNMEAVHLGMKAADPEVAASMLATEQEMRIRHFHETYVKAMEIHLGA